MKTLSGDSAKEFSVVLKKAVAQATNGKARKIAVRVSGRTFGDGSQGIGFICYNHAGEQFTLIKKVPAEMMAQEKATYREHLNAVVESGEL